MQVVGFMAGLGNEKGAQTVFDESPLAIHPGFALLVEDFTCLVL